MSSGKKNYFRHSMNARNDHKLKTFMSLFGRNWREGYFYFFSLLELCGNEAQDGKEEHTFHINTLRELWGTSTKGAHDVCNKCASCALVVCNIGTNHVTFSLPNLLNYVGKYDRNAPNKEIKEIKEKKSEQRIPLAQKSKKAKPETNVINTGLFTGDKVTDLEEFPTTDAARNVLNLMNSILFTRFGATEKNLRFVNGRLSEGFKLEDFKKVFEVKRNEWDGTDMAKYLRPSTLLGTKFDEYLSQAENAFKAHIDPLDAFFEEFTQKPSEAV
jgi:uncharacterized phage protein (TIGR02220 family)